MLLKRIDETISDGLYDLDSGPADVNAYLAEPSIGDGVVDWKIVAEGPVPRDLLHYNDAADGSHTLDGSWQKFYVAQAQFGERPLYSGSAIYFANGSPNFGGVAKSAIYLRYSEGFLTWLAKFDSAAAEYLRAEIPAFETLMENAKTKKLPNVWHTFKALRNQWPLIVVCRLSDGRFLVHWLAEDGGEDESLVDLGIDVPHSRELMGFLTAPKTASLKLISEEFQFGSGLGRNAFGRTYKLDAVRHSEYHRLMGTIPENTRSELLELWGNKLQYQINVAPDPNNTWLIFLPDGNLTYSELKECIDNENARKELYKKAKKQKNGNNEDTQTLLAKPPPIIPSPYSTTIFLTNIEGDSNKKKRIVQQIFPAVSLEYLQTLNAELLNSKLQYFVVIYMKAALTGQDSDTPSVYRYWTSIFTSALQKQPISGREAFQNFQRFARSYAGKELIDTQARSYFRLIGKLLRLQHLVVTARTDPARLRENDFQLELSDIEQFKGVKTGVFGPMSATIPSGKELIGEAYDLLRDKQKTKLDNFIRQAWAGVPSADFPVFVRGALTGMLLNELCWRVQQEGRRFSATQGQHPSRLRGKELQRTFAKGIELLMNLDKAQLFNCRLLPFLKSLEPESHRDSFNSGLITGMVYFEKKSDDNEEVKHD